MKLNLDLETFSLVDLKRAGVYKYFEDPITDIWCAAFRFDDEEDVSLWEIGDPVPERIADCIKDIDEIRAWNAAFERLGWVAKLHKKYKWPRPQRDQFFDTAADAAAMALPRSLDGAARALGLDVTKDADGYRLMMQMCRPRSNKDGKLVWWGDDEKTGRDKRTRLGAYCKQDVIVEDAVGSRIRTISKKERQVFMMDQRMNDRGITIDLNLVHAAQSIVDQALARVNGEIKDITQGKVTGVTKRNDMLRWLQACGAEMGNLKKDTVRDILADLDGIQGDARRILELRSEAGKSSNSKLASMVLTACHDARARGLHMYHGAGTGRWSGKLLQTQNFPRPVVGCSKGCASRKKTKDGKPKKCNCGGIERFVQLILDNEFDLIQSEDAALLVISSLLRSMLVAAPGHRLLAGDYAQVEARVVAWIAGQDDLVELFRTGGKIYETMAAFIYGVSIDEITKTDFRRQVGKNTVLGCGFGMGEDTFVTQAKVQTGLDIPPEDAKKAVKGYRTLYSKIPLFWKEIEKAAKAAIRNPGEVFCCGRNNSIRYSVRGQFLWCVLPSGRMLAYAKPKIKERLVKPKGKDKDGKPKKPFISESISYMGVSSKGARKWARQWAYGGMLTENVVQAMARDLLADSHLRHEAAGYMPVLSLHDEALSEAPIGHGSLEEYFDLMRVMPKWAEGLPIDVEGWEGHRFRKA